MGTNYYAQPKPCETCGHVSTRLHIGKSSLGWMFLFRSYYDSPSNYKEWIFHLKNPNLHIVDEYGEEFTLESFINFVESKQQGKWIENDHFNYLDEDGYRFSKHDFC